jgi:hypothetical protein
MPEHHRTALKRNIINWMMLSVMGVVGVWWFLTSGDNAVNWLQAAYIFG